MTTFVEIVVMLVTGMIVAMVAGAISGMRIGAEALGRELSAAMGAFFGPTAVVPATIVGLALLFLAR